MKRLIPEWSGYPLLRLVDPSQSRPYLRQQFESLVAILKQHVLLQICRDKTDKQTNEPFVPILGEADIWIWDYHPIGVVESETGHTTYVSFRYQPGYLCPGESQRAKATVNRLVENLDVSNIILDGGNLIHNGIGKIAITERALSDNQLSAAQFKAALSQHFEVPKLLVIPEEPGDITGHVDGSVRFLNPEVVAINQYHQETSQQRAYRLEVAHLLSRDFSIVSIPSEQPLEISGEGFSSAWGNRINWMRWHEKILFPAFGNQRDAETSEILNRYHLTPISLPIGALELYTHFGGSLHCITSPYWPVLETSNLGRFTSKVSVKCRPSLREA